jgi:hypothetical protein
MKSFKRNATARNLISGLAAIYLTTTPLHAGELSAAAGESIDLGRFCGVVYYTSEDDGFRVVATIADGEAGLPVRFSATLADNHTTTISVPGELGEAAHTLEISRSGDKLILKEARASSTAGSPEMQVTAE